MNTRILHCGDNLQNYNLCIEKAVVGFTNLSPSVGDLIYLAVKVNGISYIGARGIIGTSTNLKPWPNSQNYKFTFTLSNIEYCKPFNISGLAQFGGSYWAAKYLQSSKAIKDEPAVAFLNDQFINNHSEILIKF